MSEGEKYHQLWYFGLMLFKSQIIGQKEVACATRLFEFEKPRRFKYKAGQAVDIILPRFNLSTDPRFNLREGKMSQTFTLASAPEEKTLQFAMRMRGSLFKNKLLALKVGDKIKLEGPFGSFTLHADENRPACLCETARRQAVFIAGGIGITPFISMLRSSRRGLAMLARPRLDENKRKFFLFYSNRTPEDAAFLEELLGYAERYKSFVFVSTFTAKSRRGSARIDKKMLKKHLGKITNHIFYIAGTLGFVTALREEVLALGAKEEDIRTDEFSGY